MKSLFLTGGTGFVGRGITEIAARNWQVRCLARGEPDLRARVFDTLDPDMRRAIEVVPGDISDPVSLAAGMEGCDAVIHLVGIIKETTGAQFRSVHVEGTGNVLRALRDAGIERYLHMSALGPSSEGITEYFRTKFQAEELVRASGTRWTIFRPSVVFGPGDGFVSALTDVVRKMPVVPIIGSGKNLLQPIHVSNVAEAFCSSVDSERTVGRSIELGGPAPLSYQRIVEIIMSVLGIRKPLVHIPLSLAALGAGVMEKVWSGIPVTSDQIKMLQKDSVCEMAETAAMLGLDLTPFEEGLRGYLT